MKSNNYSFSSFNDLKQSGKRVGILANCEIPSLSPYSCSSIEFLLRTLSINNEYNPNYSKQLKTIDNLLFKIYDKLQFDP